MNESYEPSTAAAWGALDPHIRPDPAHSALLTIDVQADFLSGGSSPLPGTDLVVPTIGRLAEAFRMAGLPIVHIVRLYRDPDVDLVRRSMIASGAPIVRPGTPGSQLAAAIRPAGSAELDAPALLAGDVQQLGPGEAVIWKPRWSGYYRTPLHEHLTRLGVNTVVLAGFNYPNCPRATISDASSHDYRVVVASDAISGIQPFHLDEARAIGIVPATAESIIARLRTATGR